MAALYCAVARSSVRCTDFTNRPTGHEMWVFDGDGMLNAIQYHRRAASYSLVFQVHQLRRLVVDLNTRKVSHVIHSRGTCYAPPEQLCDAY